MQQKHEEDEEDEGDEGEEEQPTLQRENEVEQTSKLEGGYLADGRTEKENGEWKNGRECKDANGQPRTLKIGLEEAASERRWEKAKPSREPFNQTLTLIYMQPLRMNSRQMNKRGARRKGRRHFGDEQRLERNTKQGVHSSDSSEFESLEFGV